MRGPVRPRTAYQCSFCAKDQRQVRRLIAGPGVFICDNCVRALRERSSSTLPKEGKRCSFCGKAVQNVQYLVGGPDNVSICSECLDLCLEIIDEEEQTRKGSHPDA